MRKLLPLTCLLFCFVTGQAQTLRGFSFRGGYNIVNGLTRPNTYVPKEFSKSLGLSFGLGYSVVNLDKKFHPGFNGSIDYRFTSISAKNNPGIFIISGIDAPFEFEFGTKAFGLQVGISFLIPSKYEGDYYLVDTVGAAPFHYANNENNNVVPWIILKGHAGAHINIYNADQGRLTLFSNVGYGYSRLRDLSTKKPTYKGPLPYYVEAGLRYTIFPKN